jgi:hypothetical protein
MSVMSIDFKSEQLSVGRRDRVIRRRLSLWEADPPKNKILMDLYRSWEALRPMGLIPSRNDFDILRLKPVMGMTCIIDVTPENPTDFFVRLYGTNVPLPENMSKRTLADMHTSELYREMLAQDYAGARDIGVPLYHEIAALLDYVTHSYARLILPFASDNRNVDQLIVSSVLEKFPDLIQRLN